MTILTFFRYKPTLFPPSAHQKSQSKGKNPSLDPESGGDADNQTFDEPMNRRSSFDSEFEMPARDENLYNSRFEQWTKSVAQETLAHQQQQAGPSTSAIPTSPGFYPFSHGAGGPPMGRSSISFKAPTVTASLFDGQPSTIHETKSNHSGGSIYQVPSSTPITGTGAGNIAASPGIVYHHETKSNYSASGSLYHASGTIPSVPVVPATAAAVSNTINSPLQVAPVNRSPSFNLDEMGGIGTTGLHQRRRKNSSSSIPGSEYWKNQTPQQQTMPSPVVVGSGVPPLPGIVAVIPPDSDNGSPQLEYIEMKPLSVKAGRGGGIGTLGAGGMRGLPTMMGTVVFDD
ncbi:UNVERIFIED_CONTAM: hypothetical protein HDU68_011121 [Siphonaria sp. JEL0065]|nr:hypothetical protein HDU68_011121 [Siphonaria sp. JEL0065]